MRSPFFLSLMAFGWVLATLPAVALVERRIERRFETPASAGLNLETFSGAVRITEQSEGNAIEVVVIQTAEVDTEAEMDSRLAPLTLQMGQQDGTVSITAHYWKPVTWSWKTWPPIALAYEIKVPRRCNVRVFTRDGGIQVDALSGNVELGNESGRIFTGEIQGAVTARSHSGEVAITAASGPIDASTLRGGIMIGRAGDRTRVSSQGGYIEVLQAGGELAVRGNGSNAKIGFAPNVKHPADIELSGGGLVLVLENRSACALDLKSSIFGNVSLRGELPLKIVAGGAGRSAFEATVNGGGPRIVARAHGGSIVVRGVDPLPSAQPGDSGDLTMR